MVAYVYDVLIIRADAGIGKVINTCLRSAFMLQDRGRVSEFVEISLIYDEKWESSGLNNTNAIKRASKKLEIATSHKISSLTERSFVELLRSERDSSIVIAYSEVISSLLYFATCKRPSITYTVSTLTQF